MDLKGLAARDQVRAPTLGKGEALIKLGSTGDRVAILERVLGRPVDGVMDYDDVRVLIQMQLTMGLVPDGLCGVLTWRVVAKLYNDLIANGEE